MLLRCRLIAMLIALLVCGVAAQNDSSQRVQVSPGTSQGLLVYKVQPSYPPLARQARVQGTVVLHALIGKDGTIADLSVISGHPMLIQAAMDAVKQWRYKPYLLNGEPVLVQTTINVNFELNGPASEGLPNSPAANSSSSNSGGSSPPLEEESDLKAYTTCNLGPEFQIVQVDGPVKDFAWPTTTKNGEVRIPVEAGFRVLVTYKETELFGNLKVERLPKSQYIDEKSNLLSSLEYLSAAPGNEPVQTDTRNGLTIYGHTRNKLEGGTLSIYYLFLDQESVAVSMYLLNAEPAERKFSTLDEFKKIRDRFLDAYTKCLAPTQKLAPGKIGAPPEKQSHEPATNSSSSESGNSNPPAMPQAGQSPASEQYPGVYRVGGDVSAPKVTYGPDPQYSEKARKAHYEGAVVLWLVVDADGLPQQIKVQRSLGMGLDEEAIKAVKQWRFQPAKKDGKPVPVMINVEVNFRLYGKPGEQPASPPSPAPASRQDANTLLANASSAYAMHDCGSAIPLVIRVTEMYPQHNGAWNLLGLCYLELNDLARAEDAFKRQIDVSPQSTFAYNNLGRVYARKRNYDMATAQFRKQIEINPRDRYAHMNLAESLRSGKKCDQAIPEYLLAAPLTPENAGPHIGLARCYFDQGKQDSGVAELDKAAALTSSGPGWNALAWTLAEHNLQLDRAEQYAKLAVSMESSALSSVSLDPLTPGAYGRTRALAAAWDTLGWILYLRGDFKSAENYVMAAWTLLPNPTVSDHLAQVSEKLGRKDDSLKYSAIAVAEGEVPSEAQDSDGDAVANSRERLVRLAPSSAASNQISQDAQQWLERQGSFALPNPAKHAGSAEFALLWTHGQSSAKARWMAGDAALKDFQSDVAARMPAGPADIGAIDVLRWGTLSCEKPDAACKFRLSSAREAVGAQLRSTVKTPAGDSAGTVKTARSAANAPDRTKGISLHMLPKRVADLGPYQWGLVVSHAGDWKPPQQPPVFQTTQDFLLFVRAQNQQVQENGVWIVVTDPDAYSDAEKTFLEDIKALCRKEKIPLFISRAIDLPNGWKRYDE